MQPGLGTSGVLYFCLFCLEEFLEMEFTVSDICECQSLTRIARLPFRKGLQFYHAFS